jgi:autotransporter-associated beta strand protein
MNKFSWERASASASCGRITTRRWSSRVHAPCIAIAISLAVAGVAQAQSWDWVPTTATGTWGNNASWNPNTGFPSVAGAVVNFTAPLTANQAVSLGSTRTIGTMNLGVPGNANRYSFSNTANGVAFRANAGDTLGTATININNDSDVNNGHSFQNTLRLEVENLVINNNSVDGRLNFQNTFNDNDGDADRSPTVTLNAVAGSNVLQFQIAPSSTNRNQWGKLVVNQNAILRNSNPNAVSGTVSDQALGRTLASFLADAITLNGGVLQGGASNLIYNISANRGITLGAFGGTLQRSWTVDSIITGAGGLSVSQGGTTVLNGANTYLGATTVSAGTLWINGDQSAATGPLSVAAGALLSGTGTIGGAVSVLGGGTVGPGSGPGTLTAISAFVLASSTSALSFDLNAQNTTIGGGINDLITGVTDLTLAGTLSVAGTGNWLTVPDNTAWRLFNYSGTLTNNGISIGTAPTLASGQTFQIDTSVLGQVNLVIVPEPSTLAFLVTVAAIGVGAGHGLRRRSSPPRSC